MRNFWYLLLEQLYKLFFTVFTWNLQIPKRFIERYVVFGTLSASFTLILRVHDHKILFSHNIHSSFSFWSSFIFFTRNLHFSFAGHILGWLLLLFLFPRLNMRLLPPASWPTRDPGVRILHQTSLQPLLLRHLRNQNQTIMLPR